MSDRIDHAAAAQKLLDRVSTSRLTSPEAAVLVAGAQAHSTLALVEQQRTANLIALSTNAARMVAEGSASLGDYLTVHAKLDPMIREALGL